VHVRLRSACAHEANHARSTPSEDRRGDPLVGHDKERKPRGPLLRVRRGSPPTRWPRASARPRWPAVAKASQKNQGACICPNRPGVSAARRACTWWGVERSVEGVDPRHRWCRARPSTGQRGRISAEALGM